MEFTKAKISDIDEIGKLYDSLCDYLQAHENYPGWKKGSYPTRQTAIDALNLGELYTAKDKGRIVGSVTLSHKPEEGYANAQWLAESDYGRILVVYTLAVHPEYLRRGVGRLLLTEAEKIARAENCRSLRLDVVKGNAPAEKLYISCGYEYVQTVSLGYEEYGLNWFDLYEKVLTD